VAQGFPEGTTPGVEERKLRIHEVTLVGGGSRVTSMRSGLLRRSTMTRAGLATLWSVEAFVDHLPANHC